MKYVFSFQILALLLFNSCKKEESPPFNDLENNPNVSAKATDYYPLEVGNYWIYETFQVDTLGNERTLRVDSVVITSDTVIDGKRQFYIGSVKYPRTDVTAYRRIRDSSDCIVDQFGRITLSVNNFTDTLHTQLMLSGNDTIEYVAYKMEKHNGQVEVPAGVFSDLLNFKGEVYSSWYVWNNGRNFNRYFQKGVGEVLSTYFYINQPRGRTTTERRLIRYHIKEE